MIVSQNAVNFLCCAQVQSTSQRSLCTRYLQRVVDNPYCDHCEGACETSAHFVGECDQYTSLRQEIQGKPYLYPNDLRYLTVGDLVSFVKKSHRFRQVVAPSSSQEYSWGWRMGPFSSLSLRGYKRPCPSMEHGIRNQVLVTTTTTTTTTTTKMIYTVSSGTLNSSIPYHTKPPQLLLLLLIPLLIPLLPLLQDFV